MVSVMYLGCSKAFDTVVLTSKLGHGDLDTWTERQVISWLDDVTRRTVVNGAYRHKT